ncbi:putative pentatricopeptide repeat-containing protein At1g77010, mitochondrial [Impatiens glandulifera]|uniref:putative pentatricopeptide repeat-containing protein At1g77010, mitochondrial n=1 Tax=Impatiens glandulifera TaxID=253017 RepID=UPI001FB17F06|nr:putative pentatricopeptide repeat-containing protein At1g77010, mitochondrial [Impatiens glandulifera]
MESVLLSQARLLQSFNSSRWIQSGRQLHLVFIKRGVLGSDVSLANRLLQMYTRCDHLGDARKLFDEMSHTNCFSWNTMIEGYMIAGQKKESLQLFSSMPYKNDFSWNLMVSGLAKVGELDIARQLFNEMPMKNGIACNSMIHGYARHGKPKEALMLFRELNFNNYGESGIDSFVITTVISVCADLRAIDCGKQIHAHIVVHEVEIDSTLASSLVNFYAKCRDIDYANSISCILPNPDNFSLSALILGYANCGRMDEATKIFNSKRDPCIVLWNSMISGFVTNNEAKEAIVFFIKMLKSGVQPDFSTFVNSLSACSHFDIKNVEQLHSCALKVGFIHDLIVASSFIDVYAKCRNPNASCSLFMELKIQDTVLLNTMISIYCNCGRIEDAREIFGRIPVKSLISWNSMVVGLSRNGYPMEALDHFSTMNKMGLQMDRFSLASVISACASASSVELGELVFARAITIGLEHDAIVSTSIIDFYCKCGFVENGRKMFDGLKNHDEISFNSMLMGYATNGYGMEALSLFEEMRETGFVPTGITFTGVISACSHCGLVEEGEKWFDSMRNVYQIEPGIEHYSCMVDMFARAGFLVEAMRFITEMPFEADATMWLSVLRGCVAHGNKAMADVVVERILEIDGENSSAYVQLASIYASCGDWERSEQVRHVMKDMKILKNPGSSWG